MRNTIWGIIMLAIAACSAPQHFPPDCSNDPEQAPTPDGGIGGTGMPPIAKDQRCP